LIKSNVKLKIAIDLFRILGQKTYTKNVHFLSSNLEKHVFHKNLDVFFFKYLNACARNTPYKSLLNGPFNEIFVKTFENFVKDNNNYLLGAIILYLEALQSSRISVPTFGDDNPFNSIRHINWNNPKYKTIFEDCGGSCDVSYCTKVKTKMKAKM